MDDTISKNMSKEPVMIGPQITIREAQEIMQIWGMRHLPVTDDNNKLIGILSNRDFSRLFGSNLKGKESVTEIMTTNPYSVFAETSLAEVVGAMAEKKFGCAVIVSPFREVKGIFTTTDAMNILSRLLHEPANSPHKVTKISDYLLLPK